MLRGKEDVRILEEELAGRFQVKHVVCLPMARVGVYYAIQHLIRPGQVVLCSPYTIVDVINMILAAGGVPRFVDIDRTTCSMDPRYLREQFFGDVGAVLVTHLHGIPAAIEEIQQICSEKGVPLIEDAAQAFGAQVNGRCLGVFGKCGIFSFGAFKNVCSWFGGAIITDDGVLAAKVRASLVGLPYMKPLFIFRKVMKGLFTDILTLPIVFKCVTFWIFRYAFLRQIEWINRHVRTELDLGRRDFLLPHYKTRFTPFQARLTLLQLDGLDRANRVRGENGRLYWEGLPKIRQLGQPIFDESAPGIYTYFPVQFEDRNLLLRWLMQHNCDVAAQHLKNCAELPAFSAFSSGCPHAAAAAREVILLPTYPRYSRKDIDKNIRVISAFFERQGRCHSSTMHP